MNVFLFLQVFLGLAISALGIGTSFALQLELYSTNAAATNYFTDNLDQAFVSQAAQGNLVVIGIARLGASRATTPALKKFCLQLGREQTWLYEQMKGAAIKLGMTVPEQTDFYHQQVLNGLSQLPADAFEPALAKQLLRENAANYGTVRWAVGRLNSPEVQDLAYDALPVLLRHFNRSFEVAHAVQLDESEILAALETQYESMGVPGIPEGDHSAASVIWGGMDLPGSEPDEHGSTIAATNAGAVNVTQATRATPHK